MALDNVYFKPETYGLSPLADMDWHDESYEFDMTAAWTDVEGNLYWAHDSGCSCPLPFEDFYSVDQLKTGTLQELFAELDKNLASYTPGGCYSWEVASNNLAQFKEEVLRKWR